MAELFVISDTHLFHHKMLTFKREDGTPLRDFPDIDAMHAEIVAKWTRMVGPQDKVYHLGDVAFQRRGLDLLRALPGKKRLVRGNHDLFKLSQYREVFDEIYGVRQLDGYWLSHVPMHPQSVHEPRVKFNVHGHLHAGVVNYTQSDWIEPRPDPKYVNVCVEHTGYAPVPWDELKHRAGRAL